MWGVTGNQFCISKVLVEFGQSRKVIDIKYALVSESMYYTLRVIMNFSFSPSELCFQYVDEYLQTWVDLEIGTQMTDKFKIELTARKTSLAISDNNCVNSLSTSAYSFYLSDIVSESSI